MLNGMFAVLNKSTPKTEQLAPIPRYRWEVVARKSEIPRPKRVQLAPIPRHRWEVYYGADVEDKQRQILFNIAYCKGLQDRGSKKKRCYSMMIGGQTYSSE